MAALTFCYDTLRTGGHFLCKFYQGGEDKAFEMQLKRLFERVHREKPASSRKVSRSLLEDDVELLTAVGLERRLLYSASTQE